MRAQRRAWPLSRRLLRLGALILAASLSPLSTLAAEVPLGEGAPLVIEGAGATFPEPLYRHWIGAYAQVRPEVRITYEGVGSGEGVARFLDGRVDFGASDAAMTDAELAKVDPTSGVVMAPVTAGMVALAYNIPGIANGLRLSRAVYLDILRGALDVWDDPRIQAANPHLSLPHRAITPVVRRESSGTTFALTNHLGAVDPDWASATGPGIAKLVDWPGRAVTAIGNEGVARRIALTEGSIGYVAYELAQRLDLPVAALQNRAGRFVLPTPGSGQAALASARAVPSDLRLFIPDPEGADAYPIVSYTWLLLRRHALDPDKAAALGDAVDWMLTAGQAHAEAMGYIPLPPAMIAAVKAALARLE